MSRPLHLILVDADPTFRLGLRVCLEQLGLVVVGEVSTGADALALIRRQQQAQLQAFNDPALRPPPPAADLVVLDLGLRERLNSLPTPPPDPPPSPSSSPLSGLDLCARLKTEFPRLKIIALSDQATPVIEAAARQMGATGYGSRAMPVRELAKLVQRVAGRNLGVNGKNRGNASTIPGPLTAMRQSMRLSGLQQIEAAMGAVRSQQQQPLSWLQRSILAGRMRELRTARWCLETLWATPQFETNDWSYPPVPGSGISGASISGSGISGGNTPAQSVEPAGLVQPPGALTPWGDVSPSAPLAARSGDLQTVVVEGVFAKLQTGLENHSAAPLEIDILRLDRKRELLFTVLRQLEALVNELRQTPIPPGQLPEKSPKILTDLWDRVVEDYFGKYYTVRLNQVEQEVVAILEQEKAVAQLEILSQIPLVPELLAHWLYQEALPIDGAPYVATTPEAIRHSELLLENLVIQMANAVVQPLLNRLADVETVKKSLYHRRLMSTRDIEKFRNDLAWRARLDRWVNEPKAIFESQYRLWGLTPIGMDQTTIYAPRRDELDQLTGLQWAVTMALETRDALSPRVRAVFAFVGSGFVYVLTEVVGRGIGLIGRGVIQGIGSAWQDTRRNKRQEPYKGFNEWE
ncbi:MAG: DUF3685 domain-containing protein [Cyanobacteria bacterium P01_A01_bin.105]